MPNTTKEKTNKEAATKKTQITSSAKQEKQTKATKSASQSKTTAKPKASSSTTQKRKGSTNTKSTRKTSTSTRKKKTVDTKPSFAEYYDLPYRYNQTMIKLLAQTPKRLFVYWDLSDEDRASFLAHYGEDFFSKTKPVLLVHNITKQHSFEVEINDFANSWYLQVPDANCEYIIELGRRPYSYQNTIGQDYISITSSNSLTSPNDHILLESLPRHISYQNIKTGQTHFVPLPQEMGYGTENQNALNPARFYQELYSSSIWNDIKQGHFPNSSSHS